MTKPSAARAVADLDAGLILAAVTIAAPPERVFRALTESADILQWWGDARSYRTTLWEADIRVGGHWRASGSGCDGGAFSVHGEYLQVEPPFLLVKTWHPDWDGELPTKVTYRLEAVAAGTMLTVRHEGFKDRRDSCTRHSNGWEMVLGWLADFVQSPSSGGYFFFHLIAPRPDFAFTMNDAEKALMGEHRAYWSAALAAGQVVVFGPVLDPAGPWGLGIVAAADAAAAQAFADADPVIKAGAGFRFDILPMLQAVLAA